MAVEIPPANPWIGQSVVVRSMQEAAKNIVVWTRYQQLTHVQRDAFRTAVALDIVVPLTRVLEMAAGPPVPVVLPPPPPTPYPEGIVGFQDSAAEFLGWLQRQTALVSGSAGLSYRFGARYTLKDGTVSVPISILRDNAVAPQTKFVYHYHPGATGPSVGHGYASQGHFKPYDGAPKYIRVESHQFATLTGTLPADARQRARNGP